MEPRWQSRGLIQGDQSDEFPVKWCRENGGLEGSPLDQSYELVLTR